MNFVVTHICREDDICADTLVNRGFNLHYLHFWSILLPFIQDNMIMNKLGLPNFFVQIALEKLVLPPSFFVVSFFFLFHFGWCLLTHEFKKKIDI